MKAPAILLATAIALPGFAADAPKATDKKATQKKTTKAPALPAGVKQIADLEYAKPNGKPQLLDLYLPMQPSAKPLPIIVWVHGGGWINGSKDRCPAVWMVTNGYAVASINYRLATEAQWPAQMDDCRAALRWLRTNAAKFNLDPVHVAAWGGSAGGHLVALMGTLDGAKEERVQAVIDWYGPADLLTMPPNVLSEKRTREQLATSNGAKLLGGVVMDLPDRAKAASALYQVSAGDPPFLIMHGDQDPQVPLEQSRRLHETLQKSGVKSQLVVLPGAGHGGKDFSTPEAQEIIRKFLDRHLKPSK